MIRSIFSSYTILLKLSRSWRICYLINCGLFFTIRNSINRLFSTSPQLVLLLTFISLSINSIFIESIRSIDFSRHKGCKKQSLHALRILKHLRGTNNESMIIYSLFLTRLCIIYFLCPSKNMGFSCTLSLVPCVGMLHIVWHFHQILRDIHKFLIYNNATQTSQTRINIRSIWILTYKLIDSSLNSLHCVHSCTSKLCSDFYLSNTQTLLVYPVRFQWMSLNIAPLKV